MSAAADVLLGTPQAGSIALGALLVTLLSYRSIFWISAAVITCSAGYLAWSLRGARQRAMDLQAVDVRGPPSDTPPPTPPIGVEPDSTRRGGTVTG